MARSPLPPQPTPHPHISDRLGLFLSLRATRWRRAPRADSWRLRRWRVGGEPRDARRPPRRAPHPGRVSSPRPCPAPPHPVLCAGRPAVVPSRPLAPRGPSRSLEACRAGVGRGRGAVPKPRARSRQRPFGRVRSVAAGVQRPAGPGGPHGGRRPAVPRVLPAKRLPSEGRREDPGRDAAATVLVSPRRPSGGSDARGRCSRCWC